MLNVSTMIGLAIALVVTTVIVFLRYWGVAWLFASLTEQRRPGYLAPLALQIMAEKRWSGWSAVIYGPSAGLVLWLWQECGLTQIYTRFDAMPPWWLPASALIYLFAHDTWFYWTHRLMHVPWLYRRMHFVHHQSHPPTAWAAMSFHPWEALSGALLIPALTMIVPIHIAALGVVMAMATLFGTTNHLGWELFPKGWLGGLFGRVVITASHHERHHRRNRCNYGLYFRLWDRLCGTDAGLHGFTPSS